MTTSQRAPEWITTARDLYLVAMAVFLVTILTGILNGADVVELDRDRTLTHVHAGTVGWLTLTIVASSFLLFRAADRRLMIALAVLVPVYVAAFFLGSLPLRAIGGVALLLAIGWLLVWIWRQYLAGERSLPRLAVVLGLTTFGYGAVIGVLLQVQGALAITILRGDSIGAHAGAMTFGYLVLVAMGLIEWRVLGTPGLPRAGLVQVIALFIGGLTISLSLLAGAEQAGGGIYLLTQLVAVVVFVARVWPRTLRIDWLAASPVRHAATASLWVVAALLLFMYIVFAFLQDPTNQDALPVNILVASDHAVYIGVLTNLVLALLIRLGLDQETRRGWIGQVIFWGVNLGLLVFVVGLILDVTELKRIGAPLMGATLLVALGLLAWAVSRGTVDTAADELSAPAT
jgi:hypothetical protein